MNAKQCSQALRTLTASTLLMNQWMILRDLHQEYSVQILDIRLRVLKNQDMEQMYNLYILFHLPMVMGMHDLYINTLVILVEPLYLTLLLDLSIRMAIMKQMKYRYIICYRM